jgi:preprotein translocase subunit YajC
MTYLSRLLSLCALFAVSAADAFAQGGGAPANPASPPPPNDIFFSLFLPAAVVSFVIFHYLVIKPQARKQKEQSDLLSNLKKNDAVVTSGGIIGRVAAIEKDYILLESGSNCRIKIERSHIAKRFESESSEKSAA